MTIDSQFSSTSENALQNKVISNMILPLYNGLRNITVGDTNYNFVDLNSRFGIDINDLLGELDNNGLLSKPANVKNLYFDKLVTIDSTSGVSYFGNGLFNTKNISIGTVTFPHLTSINCTRALYSMFSGTDATSVSFPELVSVTGQQALSHIVSSTTSLTSISFPKLATINGYESFYNFAYKASNLTSVNFNALTSISGSTAFEFAFEQSGLTSITFPVLNYLNTSNDCFYMAFAYCPNLTSVSFPALTTTSFSSTTYNTFRSMLRSTSNCIVHFPSNIEQTIINQCQTSDIASHMEGTSTTVLFDLPATS